jgi:hypothetical protein
MRRSFILSLVILGLGTPSLWAQGPAPAPRPHGKPIKFFKGNGTPPSDNFPEKVFNVGSLWTLNKDDALVNALENAREQVGTYVHEQKQRLEWTPNVAFVRNRLLGDISVEEVSKTIEEQHKGKPGPAVIGKLEPFLIDGRFRAIEETREVNEPEEQPKRVWLKVVVNPETWKQIQKENRQAEDLRRLRVTEKRMIFLVKFLVGIVAVLLIICGYIRFDEWSKGYYTHRLKLVAIGGIAAVTVLLWSLLLRGRF